MRSLRLMSTLLVCLVVGTAPAVHAQKLLSAVAPSGVIVPLDSMAQTTQFAKYANCGEYFRFDGEPNPTKELGKYGVVTFMYVNAGAISVPQMAPDKLQIRLRKDTKAPAVKVIRDGGPVYPWFEISISENDFKKAPCLKESTVIPAS